MGTLTRIVRVGASAVVGAAGAYVGSRVLTGIPARRRALREFSARRPGPYTEPERKAAVEAYLAAITQPATAFSVPFAPECSRVENGLPTGFSGAQLQWDLYLHVQYAVITTLSGIELSISEAFPDVVHAEFDINTAVGARVHVSEDFVVPAADGLIHRITATITPR